MLNLKDTFLVRRETSYRDFHYAFTLLKNQGGHLILNPLYFIDWANGRIFFIILYTLTLTSR